jgi:hypothetical protein
VNDALDPTDAVLLRAALEAFLTHGFHAIPLSELETATGSAWPDLQMRYIDLHR